MSKKFKNVEMHVLGMLSEENKNKCPDQLSFRTAAQLEREWNVDISACEIQDEEQWSLRQ
jgi:hypothetical protein